MVAGWGSTKHIKKEKKNKKHKYLAALRRQRRKSTVDDDLLWLAGIGVGRDDGGVENNVKGLMDGRTAAVATLCYFHAEVHHNITATIAAIYEPISSTEPLPPSLPSPHVLTNTPYGLENGDAKGDTRGAERKKERSLSGSFQG